MNALSDMLLSDDNGSKKVNVNLKNRTVKTLL